MTSTEAIAATEEAPAENLVPIQLTEENVEQFSEALGKQINELLLKAQADATELLAPLGLRLDLSYMIEYDNK